MASTAPNGMIGRIKRLITTPKDEWAAIDGDPMTPTGIMTGWVAPLAAIGPVASTIGLLSFGYSIFGVTVRPATNFVIGQAVLSYILAFVGVYVFSLVIDMLAPSFGGQRNSTQALKVAAFSSTAAWLAQIFAAVPLLSIFGLLGLYSVYLLFVGLPVLMKVPQDKATGYTIVTIVVAVVLYMVVGALTSTLVLAFAPPTLPASALGL